MIRRNLFVAALLSACVGVTLAGCRSSDDAAVATAREAVTDRTKLRPVSLPDLSRNEVSGRDQIAASYASLTRLIENPAATAVELANAFGETGKLFLAAEFQQVAEVCFQNAQTLAPSDMRWPYYLGRLYRTEGKQTEAALAFERVLQLRPGDVVALVSLGEVYLDQGRPSAAEPLYNSALAAEPGSGAALFGLGRLALAQRDYRRAIQHLEQVLRVKPEASVVHYPLAMAYRGAGDLAKAEAHLRLQGDVKIDTPDPLMAEVRRILRSPESYKVQGSNALDRGQYVEAAAYYRQGVELAPADSALRWKLGTALALSGDSRGALEQLQEAVRLAPSSGDARYTLGLLLDSIGRHREGLDELEAAVKYTPNDVQMRIGLGNVSRRNGRADQSLRHYAAALALDPRAAEAAFGYCLALVDLGRYQEARERLTEGAARYPDRAEFGEALARLSTQP